MTRPVISGSFANQPASKLYKLNIKNEKFKGSEKIEKLGFVIGLHTKKIEKKTNRFLSKIHYFLLIKYKYFLKK